MPDADGRADEDLEDIRVLSLAAMYEDAYERFVQETSAKHLDEATKARLAPLAPDAEHRARIQAQLDRLLARVGRRQERALAYAALQDIVDVERAAREFYLAHRDRVHDPDVRALIESLCREESAHVRVAQAALDDASRARKRERPEPSAAFRLLFAEDVPLWEGVSDLDRRPPRANHASRPPR